MIEFCWAGSEYKVEKMKRSVNTRRREGREQDMEGKEGERIIAGAKPLIASLRSQIQPRGQSSQIIITRP